MGKGFVKRIADFMGIIEEEVEEEEIKELDETLHDGAKRMIQVQNKKGAVVALHTQKQMKVVVVEPDSFDEVQTIADHLKNRRPTIVNLQELDKEMAKRIVDFVSGTIYALDGNMKKIGDCIFLFTPDNVDIASDINNSLTETRRFPWEK
jgi:cell division inhibitor SepF